MAETATKTAVKRAAKKAAEKPKVDHNAVHDAERGVGDRLEQSRLIRVGLAERRAERDPIWDHLARPFPDEWIEKLPKPIKRGDERKARCEDTPAGRTVSVDGHYCGGWHSASVHLDYVGHAGITMRLNEDVGPENWSLEPVGTLDNGLPAKTGQEFWVRLTILGVSKVEVAENFKNTQEAWGDGLRRAAMRFGMGTYLWSKSEHAFNQKVNTKEVAEKADAEVPKAGHIVDLEARVKTLAEEQQKALRDWWGGEGLPRLTALSPDQAKVVDAKIDDLEDEDKKALVQERLGASEIAEEGDRP